jgi:predicted transcriptional regulator
MRAKVVVQSARDRLLGEIVRMERFTTADLARAGCTKYPTANMLISSLRAHGLVRCLSEHHNGKRGGAAIFIVQGAMPARRPSASERIWKAIRMMPQFSVGELVAATEAHESTTRRIVRTLERRGYVRRLKSYEPGMLMSCNLFQLALDPGPSAPDFVRKRSAGSARAEC